MVMTSSNALTRNDCYFFRLPGELRNLVYAYALSEAVGLEICYDSQGIPRLYRLGAAQRSPDTSAIPIDDTSEAAGGADFYPSDANQLQYISRKFRRETRGLGIRYNSLSFDKYTDFLSFLNTCPFAHAQYIRQITINRSLYSKRLRDDSDEHVDKRSKRRSELFDFCNKNASVTIRNSLKDWRQDDPWFVLITISLQIQFRGRSKLLYDFFTDQRPRELLEASYSNARTRAKEVPLNVHFYPADKVFHEDIFRTAVEGNVIMRTLLADVDEGIDRWVSVAKEIYKHGI
jgi:hypothetical protein